MPWKNYAEGAFPQTSPSVRLARAHDWSESRRTTTLVILVRYSLRITVWIVDGTVEH